MIKNYRRDFDIVFVSQNKKNENLGAAGTMSDAGSFLDIPSKRVNFEGWIITTDGH